METADLPRVLQDEACTTTVAWRSVVFTIWRALPMTVHGAQAGGQAMIEYARSEARSKLAVVVLLHEQVEPPSAPVRAVLDRNAKPLAEVTGCSVAVHPGSGFRAATVRGVLTALQLVARSKHPEKVVANDADAVAWMAPIMLKHGEKSTADESAEAFRRVRANLRT